MTALVTKGNVVKRSAEKPPSQVRLLFVKLL